MSDDRAGDDIRSFDYVPADCRNLEESDIFDYKWYRTAAGLAPDANPVDHYLREGWREGLEPAPDFDGAWLYPYFRSIGLDGPPALTFVTLRAAGWPVYSTREKATLVAERIRNSDLFDADGYAARVANIGQLDPALHYVIVGERMGFSPSAGFDPTYYGERYPDVAWRGVNALAHFIRDGDEEGRRPVSVASQLDIDLSRLDPNRETVLLMIHQASRTGAPILGYNIALRLRQHYNVVALPLVGGELVPHFRDCCAAVVEPLKYPDWNPVEAKYLARRLLASCRIAYAIVNSIECRVFVPPFAAAMVPVVTLIHEFAGYWPEGALEQGLNWSTQVVFSAAITVAAARAKYPILSSRPFHVLPQGPSELPPGAPVAREHEAQSLRRAMRPPGHESAFVVLGCGTITHRKGVDIFVACAAAVSRLKPRRKVRFIWIGRVADNDSVGERYAAALRKQIASLGLEDSVKLLDEVQDLEPAYASANLFFLSSRLDPLPNVAIDAALRGLPIVCFEKASGFSDLLGANPVARRGVVPHLDFEVAAATIVQLADDAVLFDAIGRATRSMAKATFDMDRYVGALDEIGRGAIQMMQQRMADLETISADPLFDHILFEGFEVNSGSRRDAIITYLTRSAAYAMCTEPTANFYNRRPCSGFNPHIYAHQNSDRFDAKIVNPLAHFIRSGKPDGSWKPDMIYPGSFNPDTASAIKPRIAIHGHFHYPELVVDFLQKLNANRLTCDLLLSSTSGHNVGLLHDATRGYRGGDVVIRQVPNRGRDIGAFLTAFADIPGRYDIIGHVHGKRSLFLGDAAIGERWREFLWQHLIGDLFPMIDVVASHFARNKGCGLVFPQDPHLSDWDFNLDNARDFARRLGIREPLPPFFDFPIGTMFWARPEALAPLFDLKLDWEDYPEEPIPDDGTILHTIERMLPFAARHAGYKYAMTNVPGLTW